MRKAKKAAIIVALILIASGILLCGIGLLRVGVGLAFYIPSGLSAFDCDRVFPADPLERERRPDMADCCFPGVLFLVQSFLRFDPGGVCGRKLVLFPDALPQKISAASVDRDPVQCVHAGIFQIL